MADVRGEMSGGGRRRKWIRIFQIPEHRAHPAGHTIYQITCSTFPVESPEEVTTVSTWKRFSQLSHLHRTLSTVHRQLYLHGTFPPLPDTSFFSRRRPGVVEERAAWALELLEFLASQPLLNTHPAFTNFLFDLEDPGETSEESGDRSPLGGPPPAPLTPAPSSLGAGEERSLDPTPVLTPTTMDSPARSPSPRREDEEGVGAPEEVEGEVEGRTNALEEEVEGRPSEGEVEESVGHLCRLVAEMPESDIPPYIAEAAEMVSAALRLEAEERLEDSLAAYRAAIGKLLSSVQADPDTSRQAQVKRRIAQYISKAEQIGKLC